MHVLYILALHLLFFYYVKHDKISNFKFRNYLSVGIWKQEHLDLAKLGHTCRAIKILVGMFTWPPQGDVVMHF